MCEKVIYPSRFEASQAARGIARRPGFSGKLAVYPCGQCDAWHLTSHRVSKKWEKFQGKR
jgi:hypothetical protein